MKRSIPDNSSLVRRFPELAMFPDPQERHTAWTKAIRGLKGLQILIMFMLTLACILAGVVINAAIMPHLRAALGFDNIPIGVFTGLAGGSAFGVAILAGRRRIERSLREQLIATGRAVCIKCGYDLQGQTTPRCPECGTDFDPKLLQYPTARANHD